MGARHDDTREDAALAARILGGEDPDAEAMLCRRLVPRVRAYGLRHLREEAAAWDLAQHVVVKVLEALRAGRLEAPENLPAFVMGTCRNSVLDWKKVERRRGALLEKFGPSFAASVEPELLAIDRARDRARLTHCLEELAPRERTILALTYFGERSPEQIATELEMSMGSIRVARHRALGRLHDCLTQREHGQSS